MSPPSFQIAPMIDVIFVIMLFFMVMAGAIKEERHLSMRLPGCVTASVVDLPLEVQIGIDASGEVVVNEECSDVETSKELRETKRVLSRIAQVAREASSPVIVTIRAANDTPYERVIGVLDAVAVAGLHDVTFATGDL